MYNPTENMLSDSGSHSCLFSSQCVTLNTKAKDLFFILRSEIQAMLIILLTMKGYCEDWQRWYPDFYSLLVIFIYLFSSSTNDHCLNIMVKTKAYTEI